jgi:hypothetical protein
LRPIFGVAQVLTQPGVDGKLRNRLASIGKKLLAVAVSYEILTYALATVQAVGLTLPAMVHGGPAVATSQCRSNQVAILEAVSEWKRDHPGGQARIKLSEIKGYLTTTPQCADGGTYQIVSPGHTLEIDGQTIVVPEDRVGVRCMHDESDASHHGGMMSNPYAGH